MKRETESHCSPLIVSDSYTESDEDDVQNRPSIDFGDLEDEEEEEEEF